MDKLNSEQIKNWRSVLATIIGPYALIMPEEEIEEFRNKLQDGISDEALFKAEGKE